MARLWSTSLKSHSPPRGRYVQVRLAQTHTVITVLEILSPTNKRSGEGRQQYERKRLHVLATATHLVEIDLLRAGEPMPMSTRGQIVTSDYRLLISRAEHRPCAVLLPFTVRDPIPSFRLPLQPDDPEPLVDLNHVLHVLYDRAGYDLRLDYGAATDSPLVGLNQTTQHWHIGSVRKRAV